VRNDDRRESSVGYLRPTAIVVTGSYDDFAERAHKRARAIFETHNLEHLVTELLPPAMNGARSFLVAWDGSKEGWADSDVGDAAREGFVTWLREQAYEDGSSPLDWVELQYGGDDREVIALAHDGEAVTA
jgi:hypothetical protein